MSNIFADYKARIAEILKYTIDGDVDVSRVTVEPPREAHHGDMATNAAMVLSKVAGMKPRDLAEKIAESLRNVDGIKEVEIAGPGFINFRLTDDKWGGFIKEILLSGTKYGDSQFGENKKVNIEYVSANPTGPMTVGHTRGAVVGDILASLMKKAGFDVTREYYFNDAGTQIDVLGRTTHLRYREFLGEEGVEISEGMYPGEYLKDVARALAERDGKEWLDKDESEWLPTVSQFAVDYMMLMIREDLELIGIKHDVFTNEREIVENGRLEDSFKKLDDLDLIYTGTLPPPKGKEIENWEPVPLTLFRSSNFGDSSDRPLKKRDGNWAYIMPDIGYHFDKINRGFDWMINVLGKDHGGYLERVRPAIAALSDNKAKLDVVFIAMVKTLKDGKPVKISKRSGNIITLREMVDEVGAGAIRFLMLSRSADTDLDFDFAKAIEQSKDNPVFYVQYAHARCCSVLRKAHDMFDVSDLTSDKLSSANLTKINSEDELQLIRVMSNWTRIVESSAESREPHKISYYLQELASEFHSFWNKGKDDATLRFLIEDDKDLSYARLALVKAMATVIASGLDVMGIEPLEEMN